jgi:uroporphyrinogen decarboxylase
MTDRERFIAAVLGHPVDRPPYWLFWSPWATTLQRWLSEGLAENADYRAPYDPDLTPRALPVNCGPCPPIEPTVIEQDDKFVVHVDAWGIVRKDFKHHVSMSTFVQFPVKDRAGWQAFKERWLDPDDRRRLSGEWRALGAAWNAQGIPVQLGSYPSVGLYGTLRWLLGDEGCLLAFYTMPDLVHEIMDHMTDLYLTVFEQVTREVRVDVIHMWEDMCARHGPLISPAFWDEFIGPNYRRIKAFADRHNIPVISVDTDGNPDLLAGRMLRDGVNLLFPMEVAAGCDVNLWQANYPELAMLGGVDKRALAAGPAAIDRELARIRPALERGRYIPALDHLVPDDVSWENYGYYARALKKLIGKP